MKWEELTPRQRDALVAEKVMGWHDIVERDMYAYGVTPDGPSAVVRNYTTDIAAAWQVVEYMAQRHATIEITVTDVLTHVAIGLLRPKAVAYSKEAPEAICLAALRAKGIEV